MFGRDWFDFRFQNFFFIKGYLPNPGGWLDQPAKFVEAVVLIEREIARMKESEE